MRKINYVALLFFLILHGTSVQPMQKERAQALLSTAIMHSSPREVQTALESGADVNILDANGLAPIHYAVQLRMTDILSLLIQANAQVNIQSQPTKQTPLHIATQKGNLEAVKILLQAHASTYAKDSEQQTALNYAKKLGLPAIESYISQYAKLQQQNALLLQAISTRDEATIERLIEQGANMTIFDRYNNGIIHYAIHADTTPRILELLLHSGAAINIQDKNLDTPLHIAIKSQNVPLVRVLLQFRPDITLKNKAGYSPKKLAEKTSRELNALLTRYQSQMLEELSHIETE